MQKCENSKFSIDIYEVVYIIDNMEEAIVAENLWREVRSRYKQAKIAHHELRELEQQLQTILLKGKFDDNSKTN